MDIPELYHYGREQYWFGFRDFFIFMFDGIYQVSTSPRFHDNLDIHPCLVRYHLLHDCLHIRVNLRSK